MKQVVILDGGFSTELAARGFDVDADLLWGAGAVKRNPEAVAQVYQSYVSAGSDVITSCSYQASVEGFVEHLGVNTEEALELIGDSVRLAKQVIKKQKRNVLVAGSVGPYGATKHDGSEYNGNYVDLPQWNVQALGDWHRGRVKALLDAGADILALETQPSVKEALALMALLREKPGARAWLSFSCSRDGQRTAHGEPFKEVVQQCLQQPSSGQLLALGVNCCSPEVVTPLIQCAKQGIKELGLFPVPFLAYPNSGERFLPGIGWESVSGLPNPSELWLDWFHAGATWLGGCCRTGPQNVVMMKQTLSCYLSSSGVHL